MFDETPTEELMLKLEVGWLRRDLGELDPDARPPDKALLDYIDLRARVGTLVGGVSLSDAPRMEVVPSGEGDPITNRELIEFFDGLFDRMLDARAK